MLSSYRTSFQPKLLLPSLTIGIVFGIRNAALFLGYALLVFSGVLTPYLTIGITIFMLGGIIHGITAALGSNFVGVVSETQDTSSAIIAVIVSAMVVIMPDASPEVKLYTALVAIILSNFVTGLAGLLLGKYRLGSLVSYLPYPVIGGFLAGTGVLIIFGALKVLIGQDVSMFHPGPLFESANLYHWVAGVAFAVVLFILVEKFHHYLVMPVTIIMAIVLFYLALAVGGVSVAQASQAGWLISGMPQGQAIFHFWNPVGLLQADWSAVFAQAGSLAACVVVSLISLLLNVTAIEISTGQEIDLNVELKNNGLANILSGFIAGGIGYPSLSASSLSYKLGARTRMSGVYVAVVETLILFAAGSLMSYFPNLVFGGLVFFIGMDFIYSWLYKTWFSMPAVDYAILVIIALLMNTLGFLEGVGIGLALAVVLFVAQYSRTRAIRHTLSGVSYQSSVDRTRIGTTLLRRHGDWLYILELQGFIFFGTANQVLDEIRAHLEKQVGQKPPRFMILDFRLVSGLDSSAAFSFAKLKRLTQSNGIALVFTHAAPNIQTQFHKVFPPETFRYFADLDHGIEWCENEMIAGFESTGMRVRASSLFQQLTRSFTDDQQLEILKQYLIPRQVEPGECIIAQGSRENGLHMIESGQVVVQLTSEDGSLIRLRTLGAGAFFGEMGLYSGEPASADVIAEQPVKFYVMSANDLSKLEKTAPSVAAALHRFVAAYMSERMAKLTATVQALR